MDRRRGDEHGERVVDVRHEALHGVDGPQRAHVVAEEEPHGEEEGAEGGAATPRATAAATLFDVEVELSFDDHSLWATADEADEVMRTEEPNEPTRATAATRERMEGVMRI